MGTYKPGAFGPFSGKIGDVVGSTWKRKKVVKNFPAKSSKPATQTQLEQRAQFGLVTGFFSRISKVVTAGHPAISGAFSAHNVVTKFHLGNAILGTYPDYKLDYAKVKLSLDSGVLDPTRKAKAEALADSTIQVSWELDLRASEETLPTDKAYVVFYNENKDRFVSSRGGFDRSSLAAEILAPDVYVSDIMHGWIFFVSADKKRVSETTYLGSVTIIA